jgi:choline dehydrogenase-like flavoprotein
VIGVDVTSTRSDNPVSWTRVFGDNVVLAAGAIESARLLLNSATAKDPGGLGNAHDQVGRHLQAHVYVGAFGSFAETVQDCAGPGPAIATRRFSHDLPGVVGGAMLANDFVKLPIVFFHQALPPELRRWGSGAKAAMRDRYSRTAHITGPVQEIPSPESRVRLSRAHKDRFGLPVAMFSGTIHSATLATGEFVRQRAAEWLRASGAEEVWLAPPPRVDFLSGGQHQAGTLRMGEDDRTSVSNSIGQVHGHNNLWIADGSPHVTNGGVNPVLTILALAYRTASYLVSSS